MKDIEWLKEELLRDLMRFNGNPNMTDYELGIASGIGTAINLTEKLDEPEKPVIPQHVADWIDAYNLHGNNPLREYRDLENDFNEGWTDEEDAAIYHWANKNPYAFIDALRYGYEVEKEKLYYVLDKEDATLLKKTAREGVAKSVGTKIYNVKSWKDEEKYQLTEQEIKDYDERYWAFAQEVTE